MCSGTFTLAGASGTSNGTWGKWRTRMYVPDVADWGGILKLLWYKLTARLRKRFLGDDIGTLLANAAAVSGPRDDQIKGPIVVEI